MPPSPPARPSNIPAEVLERIFSLLLIDFELEPIHTCTLVSRAFHIVAQCFLYTHASFRHPRYRQLNTTGFLRFQETVITGRYGATLQSLTYTLNPRHLVALLPRLTQLQSLSLSARHQDYHILTNRQPGEFANALHDAIARPSFRALKICGYYVEDGFNTLNYLLKDAMQLEELELAQLKALKIYPKPLMLRKGQRPIHVKNLIIGYPFSPRRDDGQHWTARTLTGYWLSDYLGLRSTVISLARLESLTVINGGIYEMKRIMGAVGQVLKRLKLEGNVHVDSVHMPRGLNAVVFDDWIKLESYSSLTSLSIDFRGNVYGEEYTDMRLMLRWLTDTVASALPQKMPRLQNLFLRFRIHTLRIQPHVCRNNYHCREDDPRDGMGYWCRLGLMLNKGSNLRALRIEINSVVHCGLSIAKRDELAQMVRGAVLSNGLQYTGYRVMVEVRDSLDSSQV